MSIGAEYRLEYNFSLKYGEESLKFDPESFMPTKSLPIELAIHCDPQHDGHLWQEGDARAEEKELVNQILAKLRWKIEEFVRKTDPFAIHWRPDSTDK